MRSSQTLCRQLMEQLTTRTEANKIWVSDTLEESVLVALSQNTALVVANDNACALTWRLGDPKLSELAVLYPSIQFVFEPRLKPPGRTSTLYWRGNKQELPDGIDAFLYHRWRPLGNTLLIRNDAAFETLLLDESRYSVCFWTDPPSWPCFVAGSPFALLSTRYPQFTWSKIDCDSVSPALQARFQLGRFPLFEVFRGAESLGRWIGWGNLPELERFLQDLPPL